MTTSLVTADSELSKVATPNLPLAPIQYRPEYHDATNNILRLFFNQIVKILGQLNTATNYTVATLPNAVTSGAGARAFVTDATAPTFGSTVAGGGAVNVPVYSDGTNWKVG
jgi:hypothetical protein